MPNDSKRVGCRVLLPASFCGVGSTEGPGSEGFEGALESDFALKNAETLGWPIISYERYCGVGMQTCPGKLLPSNSLLHKFPVYNFSCHFCPAATPNFSFKV